MDRSGFVLKACDLELLIQDRPINPLSVVLAVEAFSVQLDHVVVRGSRILLTSRYLNASITIVESGAPREDFILEEGLSYGTVQRELWSRSLLVANQADAMLINLLLNVRQALELHEFVEFVTPVFKVSDIVNLCVIAVEDILDTSFKYTKLNLKVTGLITKLFTA